MEKIIKLEKNSTEANYIKSKDKALGKVIDFIGDYNVYLRTDYFESLARSIVGQQISVKAADTIWNRFNDLCKDITPDNIINLDEESLRSVGISKTKIKYLKNLAECANSGVVDFDNIGSLDDETVIKQLTSVKGIGKWTAEMFLISSLGRLDVFSIADVGLKRSVNWIYSNGDSLTNDEILQISSKWSPYRTIASLYLWEILNRGINIEYKNFNEFNI